MGTAMSVYEEAHRLLGPDLSAVPGNSGGRKHHVLVKSVGMSLGVSVTSAAVQDQDGAVTLRSKLYLPFGRLQFMWGDWGYAGALVAWVKGLHPSGKLHLDIVRRSAGCQRLPTGQKTMDPRARLQVALQIPPPLP